MAKIRNVKPVTDCPPCADGDHADDGTGAPCPCCDHTVRHWTVSDCDGHPGRGIINKRAIVHHFGCYCSH